MLSQLSDGLWGIIRSEDGMKNEIRETVQSVYDTLSNPGGAVQDGSSTREAAHNIPIPKGETSSCPQINASKQKKQEVVQRALEENKGEACTSSNHIDNNCDEEDDPELPPGFG